MSYSETLRSDHAWKALRKRLIQTRGSNCEDCGGRPRFLSGLQVHHEYYDPMAQPSEYPDDAFKLLCADCHDLTTQALKSMLYCLGRFSGHQIVTLEIALTEAIVDINKPNAATIIHNWLLACLDDTKRAQLSFAGEEEPCQNA